MKLQGPTWEYRGGFGDGPPRGGRWVRIAAAVLASGLLLGALVFYWR